MWMGRRLRRGFSMRCISLLLRDPRRTRERGHSYRITTGASQYCSRVVRDRKKRETDERFKSDGCDLVESVDLEFGVVRQTRGGWCGG